MSTSPKLLWQPSLFAATQPVDIDRSFAGLGRIELGQDVWVDQSPG